MVLSLCLLKNWTEKLCLLLILFFTTSFPLLLLTFPFASLILFLYPHCKVCQRQHPCNSCLCSFLLRNFTCFFSSSFLLDVYETQIHSGKPTLLPELQLLVPSCLKLNHVSHQFLASKLEYSLYLPLSSVNGFCQSFLLSHLSFSLPALGTSSS